MSGILPMIETWDKVSAGYGIEITESEFKLADELVKLFDKCGVTPTSKIIELGCGSGHLSACLAMKGYNVALLDFSKGALEKAQETFNKYNLSGDFIEGDILCLDKIKLDYDLVWNSGVMEHFDDDNLRKVFTSISKVMNDKFIFLVPNPESISYLLMRYNLQGKGEWIYGQEYLRTNYLNIAYESGLSGTILGYAAFGISKWHFESTFAGHENSLMYAEMINDNIMPINEGYLVAYEVHNGNSSNVVMYSKNTENQKEEIFELSAQKYNLKKNMIALQKEDEGNKLNRDKLDENYSEEIKLLNEELENYKAEAIKLKKDIIKYEERLAEQNNEIIQNKNLLSEHKIAIKEKCNEIERLVEGNEFNESEAQRWENNYHKIVDLFMPQVQSDIENIKKYINANSFSKMIKIHSILGRFKHVDLKNKVKLILKILLRCVGIKKKLYLDSEGTDYKIKVCLSNTENIITMINREVLSLNRTINIDEEYCSNEKNLESYYYKGETVYEKEPKVSILLPVYNHANFIKSAIDSIKMQTYTNWELIIINDGSTDNLLNILEEYKGDPRIRIYSQENQRLPNTLTNLHDLAVGQFVTWTSADNIMEPEMIKVLINALIYNPNASMVFADVAIINDKGEFMGHGYREMNRDKENMYIMRFPHATEALDAECDNFINACFMYRMEVARALKGEYSADLEGLEDYDFWLRIRAFGKIVHVKNEDPLYQYRVHINTMSENLLNNKLEEHVQRSNKLIEYSHKRNEFINENWSFSIDTEAPGSNELIKALKKIHYNFESKSIKNVNFVGIDSLKLLPNNKLYIDKEDQEYIVYYKNNDKIEKRASFFEGVDIPQIAKKVRQTFINSLFWEYPVDYLDMQVVGCHIDLNYINVKKTIDFLMLNTDKLFVFCPIIGGSNKQFEKEIIKYCHNALFMDEKEVGEPVFLYASWDIIFIPPTRDDLPVSIIKQCISLAWNIGKWIMIEKRNQLNESNPLVCTYNYNEELLGIKVVRNINDIEELLDQYIYKSSKIGVIENILNYLNGIGQDIFVERPDFRITIKERKCPTEQLFFNCSAPDALKNGYIALMVDTLDKGGLEQVVELLAREFTERGILIKVFCTQQGGLVAEQLKFEGITVIECQGKREFLEEQLKSDKPLLVNTHFTKNMLDVIKKYNIPMVEVIHNMYVFQNEEMWKKEREIEKNFVRMIAVSKLVKNVYVNKHGSINPDKIKVIGNSANAKKIIGANRIFTREALGIDKGSFVFINVSSIDGRKNQLGLINAFSIYHETINSDSFLILIGNNLSDFYNEAVNEYINELNCKQHIIKLGYHEDIAGLYNASDVFVMPSYFEGWSIAATEALYCGLPIIHSYCGSAIELVDEGKNGIMICNPAGNIEEYESNQLFEKMGNRVPANTVELVSAMKAMTDNKDYWAANRHSIASRSLVKYSKEYMIDKYMDSFCEVIS